MKKYLMIGLLLIVVFSLSAESVRDLEAYKLLRENQELYKNAYEKGDFDAALEYAQKVKDYANEVQAYLDNLNKEPEPEPVVEVLPEPEPEPEIIPEPEPEPEPVLLSEEKEYQVVEGDTLWDIAAKYEFFNDPYKWPVIYESNKFLLVDPENPDLIHPGMIFHFTVIKEDDE